MSNPSEELRAIHALLSSNDKQNKCSGYSNLLQFQEHSALNNPSSLQSLARSSKTLISYILSDISLDDEEIAAQASKCLGFMIYHPCIASTLAVDDVNLVFESLTILITTTKLKSVCNLGVWCISVQQLDKSIIAMHFQSLLRAVVHALDNPMGSLSTTFEATQAVMKLSDQLSAQMRDSSHIWAPPIYRRLLSTDKRERDASERCLLKIKSMVIPPSRDLSKVFVKDMKMKLLSGMKDLLDKGLKIPVIRACGWFFRMLGSHASKDGNHKLVNDLLKILESTFQDLDPQVQIASLVAWEGLIDALVHCPVLVSKKNTPAEGNPLHKQHSFGRNSCNVKTNGFSISRIRLIMVPLNGIMSSKCNSSVQLSCLNTWSYLLHKLDSSINEPSVIEMALEPILKAIFQNGPDSKSIWLWNLGLDLLSDCISRKCGDAICQPTNQLKHRICENGSSLSVKSPWKLYSIRWMPWNISQLDFYLSMIFVLIRQASGPTITHHHRSSVYDSALQLFISALKGVKLDLGNPSTNYDGITSCLKSLLTFMKKICEDLCAHVNEKFDLYRTSIQFIDAITKELGPSLLRSPLYKFYLDLKYMQSGHFNKHLKFLSVCGTSYMDEASPLVYLIALCFHVMVQFMSSPHSDFISLGMCEYFKYILSSSDPLENLLTCVHFLYKHVGPMNLNIWMAVAQGLYSCIHDSNCKSLQGAMSDSTGYFSVCHLLIYPIVACTGIPILSLSNATSEMFDLVIQKWKLLYELLSASGFGCSTTVNFSEDLCTLLIRCLDDNAGMAESSTDFPLKCNDTDIGILHLSGNFMICILEQIMTSQLVSETDRSKTDCHNNILSGIKNCLKFVAWYLNILGTKVVTDPMPGFVGTLRASSALTSFARCLHEKQDIFDFLEVVSGPLHRWLMEMQDKGTNDQLHLLWAEILSCLRRSQPPINFGSALLKLHEPLFEKTLEHIYPPISETTINFWNSTFGQQNISDIPVRLVDILDRLYRYRKVKLRKRSMSSLEKWDPLSISEALQEYCVTTTHNRTSKRVALMANALQDAPSSSFKKRKLELTEHQKEVRRAQQGRERDTGGHGPGIRTYTNADFSQGLDDSQESQEVRDSEAILQLFRKTI